jgi:hypothetical protein
MHGQPARSPARAGVRPGGRAPAVRGEAFWSVVIVASVDSQTLFAN